MEEKKKTCPQCHGVGYIEYCANPDNGYLDTQIWNLRDEQVTCSTCSGRRWVVDEDPA